MVGLRIQRDRTLSQQQVWFGFLRQKSHNTLLADLHTQAAFYCTQTDNGRNHISVHENPAMDSEARLVGTLSQPEAWSCLVY